MARTRRVPLPLRELTALAVELTREDGAHGRWRFDGVEHITPRMYREGGASNLTPEDIHRRLEAALRAGAPAWNPYGSPRCTMRSMSRRRRPGCRNRGSTASSTGGFE